MQPPIPVRRFGIYLAAALGLGSFACRRLAPHRKARRTPAAAPRVRPDPACLITAGGMGPVRLGMRLAESKAAVPSAAFERSSDGDGAVLVDMKVSDSPFLTLYADEDDESAPINWSKRITHIESFGPDCRTPEGVRVGMKVAEVEKIYGKVVQIEESEIEARQFVAFKSQPDGVIFRLDYSGIFPGDAKVTTKYRPNGKIFSISVFSTDPNAASPK